MLNFIVLTAGFDKRFIYEIEKNNTFHMIGDYDFDHPGVTPFGDKERTLSQGEVLLAKVYVTGATLHMATEKPVPVAFDAGNMEPLAKKLRGKFTNAAITICAGNDYQHTRRTPEGTEPWNNGMELTQRAAQEVGGKAVTSIFTDAEQAKGLVGPAHDQLSRKVQKFTKATGKVYEKCGKPMVHRVKKPGKDGKGAMTFGAALAGQSVRVQFRERHVECRCVSC